VKTRYLERRFPATNLEGLKIYSLGVRTSVLKLNLFKKGTLKEKGNVYPATMGMDKAGQKEKLYLVDLDSARVKKSVAEDDKIRDLARLNASLLDTRAITTPVRLTPLQYYLRQTGDQKVEEYWKTILERTQNKLKKTGRKFT